MKSFLYSIVPILILFSTSCKKNNIDSSKTVKNLSFTQKWSNAFGGTNVDVFNDVVGAKEGGYAMIGFSMSADGDVSGFHNAIDIWVVRADANGNMLWQKPIGGSGDEYGSSIIQLPDGSFIGVGYTKSNDGDISFNNGEMDGVVFKLDKNGNLVWEKTYGNTGNDYARSIVANNDGSFIVSGDKNKPNEEDADLWIFKIDANGSLLWQKTFGGSADDYAYTMTPSADGGCILAGATYSSDGDVVGNHGGSDAWVVKIDGNGNKAWQKTLGGSGPERADAILQSEDGGFVVVGNTVSTDGDIASNHGEADAWVIKLDGNGNKVWSKVFGGSKVDWGKAIVKTNEGGFYVGVQTSSGDGDFKTNLGYWDSWIIKMDKDGNNKGQVIVGGTSGSDLVDAIARGSDGSFALVGTTNSSDISGFHGYFLREGWVLKFNDQ